MPLNYWITLWKVLFIAGVGMFAALTIVVAIGGAHDIVKLLRDLRATDADDGRNSD